MGKLGFVGLGVMGGPMAGHLVASGHKVKVWNRTQSKVQPLVDQGAEEAESLANLAEDCSIVFICVTRTEDVQSCLDELVKSAKPGTLFVDHSTISPKGAVEIQKGLVSQGFRFLDAPITGGSIGAQKGQLTIFCGGAREDFEEVLPCLQTYAKRAEHVGPPGSGQLTKMANQIAVAGALLGLCESLAFAKRAGLDVELTKNLLSGGAAGSWAFENYGPKILAEDWAPGFSVANQNKDLVYCDEAGAELDMPLPAADLCRRLLVELEDSGHGDWSTPSLFTVYEGLHR